MHKQKRFKGRKNQGTGRKKRGTVSVPRLFFSPGAKECTWSKPKKQANSAIATKPNDSTLN